MTEVTVKLLPKPVKAQVVLAAFDCVAKAGEAVANVIAAGIIPAGLEMMDKLADRARSSSSSMRATRSMPQAILLCESDGTAEEVAAEIERISAVMHASGATEIRLSRDEAERLQVLGRTQSGVSRPSAASRPTTTAWTAPFPRNARPKCWQASSVCRRNTNCVPERVPRRRRQPASADHVRCQRRRSDCNAPKRSARESSSSASKSAAPSPASTASASRKSTRCACSSGPPSSTTFHAVKRAFDEHASAQSRQGGADVASLRRVRRDACARGSGKVSGPSAVLMLNRNAETQRRKECTRAQER